jgi:hypothetical protein
MPGFHRAIAILFLVLAACSSPQGKTGSPLRAADPPSDYVYIASADISDGKNIEIGVNTDLFGGDKADEQLSITFGIYFSSAAGSAEAAELGTTGDGLSVTNPLVFSPPVEAPAELQSALNVLAKRAPDRRNLVGYLYRSPDRHYLLRIEYDSAAGANAVYFNVTNWANKKADSY